MTFSSFGFENFTENQTKKTVIEILFSEYLGCKKVKRLYNCRFGTLQKKKSLRMNIRNFISTRKRIKIYNGFFFHFYGNRRRVCS